MFRELWEIFKEFLHRLFHSRLFPISLVFFLMFSVLVIRLFQLQILEAAQHQDDYIQMSLSTVTTDAVRGNIYDRNGVLLAYDELVYSVTLKDIGYYEKSADKNQMILELIHLLDQCGETVDLTLPIGMADTDSRNTYLYTTSSETKIRQFLRDIYGCDLKDLDRPDGKYPSDITADQAMEILKKNYYFEKWMDADGNPVQLSPFDALRVVNIRYRLAQVMYKKYVSITVASNVKDTTMATVKEYSAQLRGVDVEEDYIRVYPDGFYFAQIIGYTGSANSDELAQLQAQDASYESGDVIGKSGIESVMELELSGTKGSQTMYLDNMGKVLEVLSKEDSVVGNDIYLTIDHDLTLACYKLLEEQMAGILLSNLVNRDADEEDTNDLAIPIKDVYFQLFNNNVLSLQAFADQDADWWEKEIYAAYQDNKYEVMAAIHAELVSDSPSPIRELPADMQDFMNYVFTYLCSSKLINQDVLDKNADAYKAVTSGEGNLRDFLYYAIAQDNLINLSAVTTEDRYYESSAIYTLLLEALLDNLDEDLGFSKIFYKHMIEEDKIEPFLICLSLYSQGVLEKDDEKMASLQYASASDCYTFIVECISNMEITPAQLALDPCNGSIIVTDVNTGEVLALVSYPSYDINQFSGTVDAVYYNSLLEDQSKPLFSYATQARSAPGSTYKMISSIAGLEEGVVTRSEMVDCKGIFDLVSPSPKCWIYRESGETHGPLDVVGALANSCNYFFYNVGYQLSLDEEGNYTPQLGLDKLSYYCSLMGLSEKSGIELNEYAPMISNEYPVTSAIGQGTNNFTPSQMARYITTIANRGTLFDLTVLDKVVDCDGNVVDECQNASQKITEISDSTWDAVWDGMYAVTHEGTVSNYFRDLDFDVSGKTGSAQEDLTRANHALFVSFAPSAAPEIAVTCAIRHGYSSGYTASLAKEVYRYYFGENTLEDIMNGGTLKIDNIIIND